MNKKRLLFALKFVISFGLLITLAWIMRKDIKDVLGIIGKSDKTLLGIALLINTPLAIGMGYRLRLLMRGQNISLTIKDGTYLTFVGYFFNNFLPTAIGGDIAKIYYASKKTSRKLESFTAVVADRMIGFIAVLFIALIGLMFIWKDYEGNAILWMIPAVAALSATGIFFLFKKNHKHRETYSKKGLISAVKEKFSKLYAAINLYRHSPALLIKTFILSIFLQSVSMLCVYLFILCVDGKMQFFRLCLIIPLIWTVSMLPSLNGLGVREGAFIYFLKGYIGPEKAFAVSILWLGGIMLNSAIGGVLHLLYPVKLDKKEMTL